MNGLEATEELAPIGKRFQHLSEAAKKTGNLAYIAPLPTIDSSFAIAIDRAPTSYLDPRIPAIMVAMAYLNAVEGPLWAAVRGTGLPYSTSLEFAIESGFIALDVHRSPDSFKAFEASQKVLKAHITGEIEFDPSMLEGAMNGIVVSFADEQQTLTSAAASNFTHSVMKQLPEDHQETLLKKVRGTTVAEIKQVRESVIFDVFRPEKANVLVTCAPSLKVVR